MKNTSPDKIYRDQRTEITLFNFFFHRITTFFFVKSEKERKNRTDMNCINANANAYRETKNIRNLHSSSLRPGHLESNFTNLVLCANQAVKSRE